MGMALLPYDVCADVVKFNTGAIAAVFRKFLCFIYTFYC